VVFSSLVAMGLGAWTTTGAAAPGLMAESPHNGFGSVSDTDSPETGVTVEVRPRDVVAWFSSKRGIALAIRGRTWFCANAGTTARRKSKASGNFFMATLNPLT
jgi:hypothetical protein